MVRLSIAGAARICGSATGAAALGNGVPKKVWCDMEVEGGGWTCDGRTGATSGYSSTGYIMAYSTPSLPSLASQALLRRLFKM